MLFLFSCKCHMPPPPLSSQHTTKETSCRRISRLVLLHSMPQCISSPLTDSSEHHLVLFWWARMFLWLRFCVSHIPFKAGDSDASGSSRPRQTDEQTRALWTGKERRSNLCKTEEKVWRFYCRNTLLQTPDLHAEFVDLMLLLIMMENLLRGFKTFLFLNLQL